MRRITRLVVLFCLLWAAAPAAAADAPTPEERFPRSAQQAALDGYRLIGLAELKALLAKDPPPVLIDARPDYEYRQGRIPGSLNMPFEPGEAHSLAPAKRAALEHMLGPDRERPVVIYCRAPQ